MIDAIHTVHPRALIMVPGTAYSRFIQGAVDDPLNPATGRVNLVYKTHPYDAWATIQATYELDRISAQVPVFIGEFGDGAFMGLADVQQLLTYAESKPAGNMGWCAWLFSDEACPCLLSNRTTFAPTTYGIEVRDRLRAAG